ncbi:hypothetical protein GJ496_000611 [Pomphorhynchus laevis]|nr:hypothetical protein GJ496_000611 [Pomphorhynchus laevis]
MDAKKNMDVESLGIITESAFMEYFFKGEIDHLRANKFTLFHYNGLLNSNVDKQVRYREASAAILDIAQLNGSIDATPVESCLRTKWPTIKLTWDNANTPPSLN